MESGLIISMYNMHSMYWTATVLKSYVNHYVMSMFYKTTVLQVYLILSMFLTWMPELTQARMCMIVFIGSMQICP